jgi:hypothetical protein
MQITDLTQMQLYYGTGITLRRAMHRRDRRREGNQKLECGCCAHYTGIEYRNLKLAGGHHGRGNREE